MYRKMLYIEYISGYIEEHRARYIITSDYSASCLSHLRDLVRREWQSGGFVPCRWGGTEACWTASVRSPERRASGASSKASRPACWRRRCPQASPSSGMSSSSPPSTTSGRVGRQGKSPKRRDNEGRWSHDRSVTHIRDGLKPWSLLALDTFYQLGRLFFFFLGGGFYLCLQ